MNDVRDAFGMSVSDGNQEDEQYGEEEAELLHQEMANRLSPEQQMQMLQMMSERGGGKTS